MVLTIDKFGRVLIPKAARKALGVGPGNKIELLIHEDGSGATLRPVKDHETTYVTYSEGGWPMLAIDIDLPADFDTVNYMKEIREDYLDKKLGPSAVLY